LSGLHLFRVFANQRNNQFFFFGPRWPRSNSISCATKMIGMVVAISVPQCLFAHPQKSSSFPQRCCTLHKPSSSRMS